MAYEGSIQQQIQDVIKPWDHSKQRPPFTESELTVMAIVAMDGAATADEIFDWIFHHFRYCRELARKALFGFSEAIQQQRYNIATHTTPGTQEAVAFRESLDEVFWCYEPPLQRIEVIDNVYYSICDGGARVTLRNVLPGPEVEDVAFPFFQLPPELRNTIYEMLFSLPQSGILTRTRWSSYHAAARPLRPKSLCLLTRSHKQPFSFDEWSQAFNAGRFEERLTYKDRLIRTPPLQDLLAPLLINKQFHREALPIFYNINHFHFPSLETLLRFLTELEQVSPRRLQYLGHISFDYESKDSHASAAFNLLSLATGLRKLEIRVDEADKERQEGIYKARNDEKNAKKYSMASLKGLRVLRKIQADEVVFHGCPTLEGMIKAEMTRSRAAESSLTKKTRKRKSVAGGGVAGGGDDAKKSGKAKRAKSS